MKGNIILTMKEQRLNDIMVKLLSGDITIEQACRLTGLSERQMYRKRKLINSTGLILFLINLNFIPLKKVTVKSLKIK